MDLGGMKAACVRPRPRDLGVLGAWIVRCGLSCLVDLISPLRFPSWSRYILGSGVELN